MSFDPELTALGLEISLYHIERGIFKFKDFSNVMLNDFGEPIRKYIKPLYAYIKSSPEAIEYGWDKEMDNLNDLKFMEENQTQESKPIVTIEDIVSVFANYSDKKKSKDIKSSVNARLCPDNLLAQPSIDDEVDKLLREDRKLGDESFLTFSKGYYSKRKKKTGPGEVPLQISEYTGRAGECAVMSELLFNNYNVNRMIVDEGVDLVAVKDNIYYYIQVKTVSMKDGRINVQVSIENFDKFIGNQMRYVIVARCKGKDNEPRNIFFTFTQQEIQKGIYDRYIKRGEKSVSIKIKFHERSGDPILYDEKETSAKWNMNRFEL